MAKLEEIKDPVQTELIVFPIIDVSGSMSGEKIGKVNEAMREVPSQLVDINENSVDGKLLIAPMEFSTGAKWFGLQNGRPAEVETFVWHDMKAGGQTDFGAAFKLLTEKLTTEDKGGWMKGRGGASPVLILISDGGPTDDYKKPLEELKNRGWFNGAIKFAVAVGKDADRDVLAEFTGNPETVIDTELIRCDLAAIVKTVLVSASQTASKNLEGKNYVVKKEVVDPGSNINAEQEEANKNMTDAINNINKTGDLF